MKAISLFCGAGGMDVGFERAGAKVLFANEFNADAVATYRVNHPGTHVVEADVRTIKKALLAYREQGMELVFGGPPCQGFSVAGKMDPNDTRSTMVWEFFDTVELVCPRFFVMENVKALGELARWEGVRKEIFARARGLGYHSFARVFNAADFGVPQKRERVFFVGVRDGNASDEERFDALIAAKRRPRASLRDCLLAVGKVGTEANPLTCTARITLASHPVLRKSPYAGMLFNGMGRPLDFNGQANTLPASMGGNKTPIVDERLLHDPSAQDWVVAYHQRVTDGGVPSPVPKVPEYLRRLAIKEAAAIQTFPMDYVFCGEKSSVYRQIGNAVPCALAQAVAEAVMGLKA